MTMVSRPASARRSAADAPAGPPPNTATRFILRKAAAPMADGPAEARVKRHRPQERTGAREEAGLPRPRRGGPAPPPPSPPPPSRPPAHPSGPKLALLPTQHSAPAA